MVGGHRGEPAPMQVQQEVITTLARWLATEVEPNVGWSRKSLAATPVADGVQVRVAVESLEGDAEKTDTLPPEAGLSQDVLRLREAMTVGAAAPWRTAHVAVTATGWPQPKISADARFDYPD
jgi:hypothetical protein